VLACECDEEYQERSREYTQRLIALRDMNAFDIGKDGAPNWPDPPRPRGYV
jgi:hypothetical protein